MMMNCRKNRINSVQKIKLHYIFLLIILPAASWAQLTVYPLEKKPGTQNRVSARTKDGTPISVPFWDDFSFATEGHAVDSFWVDNDKVLVNSGQAINPPTINVATFDGLNELGLPYNSSDNLDFGYRDTLESQPIKMTEIASAFRNEVFLSFFYQAGGYGEPPDPQDFLRVEFKNDLKVWETIITLTVEEASDPTLFYDTLIRINQDKYYHDDFQFRFISFGRKSGRFDAWHIDYVYLNKGRNENDNSYPDRSINSNLSEAFEDYYSMPVHHFFPTGFLAYPTIGISNLENSPQPTNYEFTTTVRSFKDEILLSENILLFSDSVLPTIGAFEKRIIQLEMLPPLSNFNSTADSIYFQYEINYEGNDTIQASFSDIDFRINAKKTFGYVLSDYYAYDDGDAEYMAGLTVNGNQLAYRFDMLTTEQDTISELSIHFPYFAGTNATSMRVFVMDDENGEPGNILYEETVFISQAANNEFLEIPLTEGVVVKDTFYIGYQEPFTGDVRIGLDKSNDSGDRMFFRQNASSTWSTDWITGSLMIRPHFGKGIVITGITEESNPVSFYPNPNAGEFYVKGNAEQLHLYTITGQPVGFSVEDFGEEKRIRVSSVPTGLYIVRYKSGAGIFTEKILIRK
jgi:hypothetical protein